MPIISIFIALILGVLALAFVLQPLYRHRLPKSAPMASWENRRDDGLSSPVIAPPARARTSRRPYEILQDRHNTGVDEDADVAMSDKRASLENEQSARAAIQEVELDYQLGNITEADYTALRERYLRRALVAMKSRYDHHDRDQQLDDDIEARLRQMREQDDRNE